MHPMLQGHILTSQGSCSSGTLTPEQAICDRVIHQANRDCRKESWRQSPDPKDCLQMGRRSS